jgi:hypothetical protein
MYLKYLLRTIVTIVNNLCKIFFLWNKTKKREKLQILYKVPQMMTMIRLVFQRKT